MLLRLINCIITTNIIINPNPTTTSRLSALAVGRPTASG